MSIHYLKDVPTGSLLLDIEHSVCVIKESVFDHLGEYSTTLPTSPSSGRIYRRNANGWNPGAPRWYVVVTEQDPTDARYVLHHPCEALFV